MQILDLAPAGVVQRRLRRARQQHLEPAMHLPPVLREMIRAHRAHWVCG